jgi:hypothetical protein
MDQAVHLFEAYQAVTEWRIIRSNEGIGSALRDPPAAEIALQPTTYATVVVDGILRVSALAANFDI